MLSNDVLVLKALRQDARVKHTTLARQHNWPVSTTHERVNRCIKQYVTRLVSLLNHNSIGYGLRTLWVVTPQPKHRAAWKRRVAALPQVNNLSKLHSGAFCVETVSKDQYEEHCARLELGRHAKAVPYPLLEEVTREQFMTSARNSPENNTITG